MGGGAWALAGVTPLSALWPLYDVGLREVARGCWGACAARGALLEAMRRGLGAAVRHEEGCLAVALQGVGAAAQATSEAAAWQERAEQALALVRTLEAQVAEAQDEAARAREQRRGAEDALEQLREDVEEMGANAASLTRSTSMKLQVDELRSLRRRVRELEGREEEYAALRRAKAAAEAEAQVLRGRLAALSSEMAPATTTMPRKPA